MYTFQALLYFLGLFIVSIAFGKMYDSQEIGFLVLGGGIMGCGVVTSMIKYLK